MPRGDYPSAKQDQFVLRMPDGMRDRLKEIAALNGRSLNAEIVHRLEASFPPSYRLGSASIEDAEGNLYVYQPRPAEGLDPEAAIDNIASDLENLREMLRAFRKTGSRQTTEVPSE